MRLVIGGREQGKLNFALQRYKINRTEICDGRICSLQEISQAKCVYRLHDFVRRAIFEGLAKKIHDKEVKYDEREKAANVFQYVEPESEKSPGKDEYLRDYMEVLNQIESALGEEAVVICDEVGLGIVPIDKCEREYREAVGRLCCRLAEKAQSVERVYCGIGIKIK